MLSFQAITVTTTVTFIGRILNPVAQREQHQNVVSIGLMNDKGLKKKLGKIGPDAASVASRRLS